MVKVYATSECGEGHTQVIATRPLDDLIVEPIQIRNIYRKDVVFDIMVEEEDE